jgi:hypothetical protein
MLIALQRRIYICEKLIIDLYKVIDKERIIKALENGKRNDTLVLFEYSALTKEEFMKLKEKHLNPDDFIKQMNDYLKENEKKK